MNMVRSNSMRLDVDAIRDYPSHRFKQDEWSCTKKELIEKLVTFYQDVLVPSICAPFVNTDWVTSWWPPWQPTDIDHFLSCNFHLVDSVMFHHKRCIATLIRQGVIRRSAHRLELKTK